MGKKQTNAKISGGKKCITNFYTLAPTNNRLDDLIEGWCIPLDGHLFRVFVAYDRTRKNPMGYYLKLMLEWGRNHDVNLDIQRNQFPQTMNVFKTFCQGQWENNGRTIFSYKYVEFGPGENNKNKALSQLHSIVKHAQQM